jgi:hypothetical protein
MPRTRETLHLEDLVITVYAALDDALAEVGFAARNGRLVPRPGLAPKPRPKTVDSPLADGENAGIPFRDHDVGGPP